MKTPDVSIIIVSYNTKSFLQQCLQSVYDNVTSLSYEIIVIDNDSQDGSATMVAEKFPKVKLIKNANEGFAKANNKGVAIAAGTYILFLNPDTIVHKNTLESVHAYMEKTPEAGAATCVLEMENGQLDYAAHRGFPSPWNAFCYFSGITRIFPHNRLFSGYTLGWQDKTVIHEIDALAGAFMFTRREAGEQVGWWDEDYFFNGEDIDFCYKLKEKGWKLYYLPDVSITHYNGVAGGTKKATQHLTTVTKETKQRVTRARFEAMQIFYKKHYMQKYPFFVTWIVLTGISYLRQRALGKI